MNAAPDIKYTDRDVRENSDLVGAAYAYVENYQGEFQYLIDCKMRVASGETLTTGLVRGILNCMRIDPRCSGLPKPLPADEVVTPFRNRGPKYIQVRVEECERTDFHPAHRDEGFAYCSGIYKLNREPYKRPARMSALVYAIAAKSPTALIHKAPGWVEQNSWCVWYPNYHSEDFYADPDFYTRPLCAMPRVIKNPILLTHPQYLEFQANEELSRLRCERCFN